MAIIVEDGTIVPDANSYVTELELTTYASERGITIAGDTEQLLIIAMDYIESLDYIGIKRTDDQPLQWPRVNVVIDGYIQNVEDIPQELKDSQIQVAISTDGGNDPLADIPRLQKRVGVGRGAVDVEYETGSATTLDRKITSKLQKLLASGATGTSFSVSRG